MACRVCGTAALINQYHHFVYADSYGEYCSETCYTHPDLFGDIEEFMKEYESGSVSYAYDALCSTAWKRIGVENYGGGLCIVQLPQRHI
jgi:hypothetical protein